MYFFITRAIKTWLDATWWTSLITFYNHKHKEMLIKCIFKFSSSKIHSLGCVVLWVLPHGYMHTTITTRRMQYSLITCKTTLVLFLCSQTHRHPNPWHAAIKSLFHVTLSFQECHINGIVQHTTFWDELVSLNIMPLRWPVLF